MKKSERLQKYLARCGLCSRRKAEEYIREGRITVDGRIVTEMGTTLDPDTSEVLFDGARVSPEKEKLYFLLNKPKGYVTTMSDPQNRPVVTSLVKGVDARLFPVGRLDFDTEGALLLTNDGELAQKIQHPSFETNKTYEALVRGVVPQNKVDQLEKGVILDGKMTSKATIRYLNRKGKNQLLRITIHEGRKHQVKKMFQHIGHPVLHLRRTAYGKLTLGSLPTGQTRRLNPSDIKKIFL